MHKNAFSGTVAELIRMNLTVNGVKMDQTSISVMSRLGLMKAIGVKEKPEGQRGKPATIWEIPASINASLTAVVPEDVTEAIAA